MSFSPWDANRIIQSAVWSMTQALRGKFSKRQGATCGRFPLTSKRAPRNFYKGKGTANLGIVTKKGRFMMQSEKVPQYVVPDLVNCDLKPYVSYRTPKLP